MKNILFCSVGRRGRFIQDFKKSAPQAMKIIATENSNTSPAIYFSDKFYIVPLINDVNYINILLDICDKENIGAIATFIDPEIELLAKNREKFEEKGVIVLAPLVQTAQYCFDKYLMYKKLKELNIPTVETFDNIDEFNDSEIDYPVFVKPRNGSGSVGATKVNTEKELIELYNEDNTLIIQEYMDGTDLDADVYIDTVSKKCVSAFTKKKLETKIGGANKTISFKDDKLFKFIEEIVERFDFCGAIDMDFFYKNGEYYLSEINPRFGGAYIHAYGCGVDFPKMVIKNINGEENNKLFGDYEEDIMMLMYDDVVIKKLNDEK